MRGAACSTALAIAIALFGSACGGELANTCTSDGECAPGQECIGGACHWGGDGGRDADLDSDTSTAGDTDGPSCDIPCGAICCESEQVCFRDRCIADNGSCTGSSVCPGDTTCVDELCVPFGEPETGDFDGACSREPEPLDTFEAEVQCEWPGPDDFGATARSVRIPPLVSDLDGDGVPEIVFADRSGVKAISGSDCTLIWEGEHAHNSNQQLAVGDVDDDGLQEVCGRGGGAPFCFNFDGTLLWEGLYEDGRRAPVISGDRQDVGISIVNVDGLGTPEVVVGLTVFDGPTGLLLSTRAVPMGGTWAWTTIIPALADVDGDGHVEALTGGLVYDLVDGTEEDWGSGNGFTALAEMSADHPGPEVVVVSGGSSEIRVHAIDGTILYEHATPGNTGGAPTIADLDGDGRAEFSTAAQRRLTAFDLDCVGTEDDPPDPAFCANPEALDGIMWSVETHEYSSGVTGSSVFDFEGDGPVEIVYGDECWTRVFDGATGAVKYSMAHQSGTGIEYPVVADVDGDFYTEIVVPHERYDDAGCPATDPLFPTATREPGRRFAGITVLRDVNDRWAPSRQLWSQHTEHWSNRQDDGSVPLAETPSWTTHNSYRQALPREDGTAIDMPDLTIRGIEAPACDIETASQPLEVTVCNRGTLPVAAGVPIELRLGSVDGELLCSLATAEALAPGECETVGCTWTGITVEESHEVFAVVDAVSEGAGGLSECHEENNQGSTVLRCPPGLI